MCRAMISYAFILVVALLCVRTSAASASPTGAPTPIPDLRPAELDAMIRIYQDTEGSSWSDCYSLTDPCASCAGIVCEVFGSELRITELNLPNVGMLGTMDVADLDFFTRLKTIDFSTNVGSPTANDLAFNPESTTASGIRCAPIEQCLAVDATCTLTGYTPVLVVCDATAPPTPAPQLALDTPVILGIVGGCVGFVLICLILFVAWTQRQERLRMLKERRRHEKRRRTQARRQGGGNSRRHLNKSSSNRSTKSHRSGKSRGGVQTGKYGGGGGGGMKKKGYVPEQSWGPSVAPEDRWEEMYDYNSGRAYWANNATNQFSWEDPKTFMNTGYDPFFAQNGPGYGHDGGSDWQGSYDVGAGYGGHVAAPPPAPPSRGAAPNPPVAQAYYG